MAPVAMLERSALKVGLFLNTFGLQHGLTDPALVIDVWLPRLAVVCVALQARNIYQALEIWRDMESWELTSASGKVNLVWGAFSAVTMVFTLFYLCMLIASRLGVRN